MANTITLKRSAVPSKVPLTTDLSLGEIAINTYDGEIYLKKDDGAESIVKLATDGHLHDDRYYTETELDISIGTKYDKTGGAIGGSASPTVNFTPNASGGSSGVQWLDDSANKRATFYLASATGEISLQRFSVAEVLETSMTLSTDGNVAVNGSVPTAISDLTRKDYVDLRYLKTGGTITGDITLLTAGTPTLAIETSSVGGAALIELNDSSSVIRGLVYYDDTTGDVVIQRKSAVGVTETTLVLTNAGQLTVNGDAVLTSGASGGDLVADLTPQLGGDLDVNGQKIVSVDSVAISFAPGWELTSDFINEYKIMGSDISSIARFGHSVAIYGDTAIVGADYESSIASYAGAAYIFTRSGTTWIEQHKIQASDASVDSYFGNNVAIYGDTVIVGAYQENTSGIDAGAAYVFIKIGNTWTEQQKLISSDIEAGDYFGNNVAIYGDTVIVGAYQEDTGGVDAGAVYIFTRTGSVWTEQQKIQSSDKTADDRFGYSVDIYGDTVIVGAESEDTGSGAAYIFTRTDTTWTQRRKIIASDAPSTDRFGGSVAIYGNTVIVGARYEDEGASNAGAAYVFVGSGTTWNEQQKLIASDAQLSDYFGHSVAIYGDTVVVGAYGEDTGGSTAGAAYVFTRTDTTWTQYQKIMAGDKEADDNYGFSVAIYSDTVFVGAYGEDTGGLSAGAAYLYMAESFSTITIGEDGNSPTVNFFENAPGTNYIGLKAPDTIPTSRTWTLPQNDPIVVEGQYLTTDVNGSMRFGPCNELASLGGEAVSVAPSWGSSTDFTNEYKMMSDDIEADDYFGYSVAIYGDTAIIGAYGEDTGGAAAGAAYIFIKVGNTWIEQQKLIASDIQAIDYFGFSVAIYGDTVIVGAYGEDTGADRAGAIYIFTRSGIAWTEQQKLLASNPGIDDYFGHSVAIYGDTVIVGAPYEDTGADNAGAAYTFTRTGTTWTFQQKLLAISDQADDNLGYSVAIYGDTVVVGAYREDSSFADNGAAVIFTRTDTIWTQQQKLLASNIDDYDRFGYSVDIYGDTVIVGAPHEDTTAVHAGSAYIFTRTGTTWTEQQKIQASGAQLNGYFGDSVSIYNDTVIVGANGEDTGGIDAGAAYIFTRTGTTWTELQKIQASDKEENDQFGISVAIHNNSVMVGANGEDTGALDAGAAYFYEMEYISTITVGEDGYSPSVNFFENTPGTNYIGLKAPVTIPTSRTWILPQDDPAVVEGYYLTTDVSGALSFAENIPTILSSSAYTVAHLGDTSNTEQIVSTSYLKSMVDYTDRGTIAVAGVSSYLFAAGIWTIVDEVSEFELEIYTGSAWQTSYNRWSGGTIISDGTNVRLYNTDPSSRSFEYLKQGLQR